MPTSNEKFGSSKPVPDNELKLTELLELLVRHFGHHEGLFDLAVHFKIGAGAVRPEKGEVLPGAIFGFAGISLKRVDKVGPNTLDAAVVNPRITTRAESKKKSRK